MSDKPLALNVLRLSQPIGEFYIASIPAKDLVEISYSDVRRLAEDQRDFEKYLGIQRPVSGKRIKDLKKYIVSPDATFPTGVILAIDDRCAEFDETQNLLTISPYTPDEEENEEEIPYDRIAKVIDGQHRIAAFMDEDNNWQFKYDDSAFDVNVVIFVGIDIAEQANIFATVNLAQTKVNRSLVYDLTELAKTSSPHKICHNVAVALDRESKSPLFQRIKRLGTATPGRSKEPLTQAAFVESLIRFISPDPFSDRNTLMEGKKIKRATWAELKKFPFRNLFIDERDVDIAEILFNYFSAVENKWPKSWAAIDRTGNLLPRSNAFKALMKFLKEDVYLALVNEDDVGRVPSVREMSVFFEPINFDDDAFTSRNFAPGSGGQSTFLKMLRGEISLEDMVE